MTAPVHREGSETGSGVLPGRLPALSGVRFPAFVLVVLQHAGLAAEGTPPGPVAVETFFVLSGFLITGVLIRSRRRTGSFALRRFYLARALRILPPLVTTTLVSALVLAALPVRVPDLGGQVLHGLTLTEDYFGAGRPAEGLPLGHLWTLSVEEKFYLAWPLLAIGLVWLTRRRSAVLPLLVLELVVIAYAVPALRYRPVAAPYPAVYFEADCRLGGLLLGCTAAFFLHRQRRPVPMLVQSWVGIVGLVGLGLPCIYPGVLGSGQFSVVVGMPVAGISAVLLIGHLASTTSSPLARLLGLRPLAFLGDRTYGMYLWHLPALAAITVLAHPPDIVAFFIDIAISFVLSLVLARVVERPTARLHSRLLARGATTTHLVRGPRRLGAAPAPASTALPAQGARPGDEVSPPAQPAAAAGRQLGLVISLAVAIASSVAVGIAGRARTVDDGDIVLRYVHNVLHGRGWVWNTGYLRNACTSTLHPLAVVAAEALGLDGMSAAHTVGTVSLVVAAISALILLRRLQLPYAGLVAAAGLPLLPLWRDTWGLETETFVALLLASGAVAASGTPRARFVAALSLTRPDGILLIIPGLLRGRSRGWRWCLRFSIVSVLPALIVAQIAVVRTGLLLPASVGAKAAQGREAAFAIFTYLPNMLTYLDQFTGGRQVTWAVLGAGGVGLVVCVTARLWPLVDIAAVTIAQTLLYAIAGVPGYYWYYVPFLVMVGVVTLAGAETLVRRLLTATARLGRRPAVPEGRGLVATRAAVLTCLALAGITFSAVTWGPGDDLALAPREASYVAASGWLQHQGPVSSLGVSEVGVFGVQLPDAKVVDIAGLVTSPELDGVQAGRFLAHPTQWLALHLTVGGDGGIALTARHELDTEATQAGLSLDNIGLPSGLPVSVWSLEGPLLENPAFQRTYKLVAIFTYPGAPPQAMFRTLPGVDVQPGLTGAGRG